MFRRCIGPRRQMSTQFDRFHVAVLMKSATPGTAQALTATELAGVALNARIELYSPSTQSCEGRYHGPANRIILDCRFWIESKIKNLKSQITLL